MSKIPNPTETAPDPFDVESLRLSTDYAVTGATKKLLTRVPVRKPKKQEFVRVRRGEEWRMAVMLIEDEANREVYSVDRSLQAELTDDATPAILFTAITKTGDLFLWMVKTAKDGASTNPWHESALAATAEAEEEWVKVVSNMNAGQYEVHQALAQFPEPEWPEETFSKLLGLAFKGKRINDPEHPFLKKLRGEA